MAVVGFTGTVDDKQYARLMALMGPRVAVESSTAWAPTVTAGVDRSVTFAAGAGRILGLRDDRAGTFSVAQAINATGANRVDLIVMRADWAAKTVTPTAITGSSPTTPPAYNKTLLATGDVYDFPVCVCITPNGGGAYSAGDIRDIRLWGGSGGALSAAQSDYLSVHDLVIGQEIRDNGSGKLWRVSPAGTLLEVGTPSRTYEAAGSGVHTITQAVADIAGASVTFTTTRTSVPVQIKATYDWRITALGTGYCYGEVAIDGVTQSRRALFLAQSVETRVAGALTFRATLATAGSHTIKLQGHKDVNAGTATFDTGGATAVNVTVFE